MTCAPYILHSMCGDTVVVTMAGLENNKSYVQKAGYGQVSLRMPTAEKWLIGPFFVIGTYL